MTTYRECECRTWARLDAFASYHHPNCEHFEDETQKVLHVKIAPKNDPNNSYVETVDNINVIVEMLRDCEDGDGYVVTATYMTNDDYGKLPEFTGF